jgi:hypothetical protein
MIFGTQSITPSRGALLAPAMAGDWACESVPGIAERSAGGLDHRCGGLPTPRAGPIDLTVEEGTIDITDVETLRFRRGLIPMAAGGPVMTAMLECLGARQRVDLLSRPTPQASKA